MESNDDGDHPLLGITMKTVPYIDGTILSEDTFDHLTALRTLDETHYKCSDYLKQSRNNNKGFVTINNNDDHNSIITEENDIIDPSCREKMCEWCYRVVDCGKLQCDREVVAFTLSYVDRYMDKQPQVINRKTYKLVAITSFLIATKVISRYQLSMNTLVQLSRGEFTLYDISNMECNILQTLQWRVNPPTTQVFIRYIQSLFYANTSTNTNTMMIIQDNSIKDFIFENAYYLAELSVYDYRFITRDRFFMAVACVTNAIDLLQDIAGNFLQQHDKETLLSIKASIAIGLDLKNLKRIKSRLWYLYSCSAQGIDNLNNTSSRSLLSHHLSSMNNNHPTTGKDQPTLWKGCPKQSPVSVNLLE